MSRRSSTTIAGVMLTPLIVTRPNTPLSELLVLMRSRNTRYAVVDLLHPKGSFGIVTQRDIQAKTGVLGRSLDQIQAHEVMSIPSFMVVPSMRIDDCSALLLEAQMIHTIVVHGGQPVGIIRATDIFQTIESRS